MRPKRLLRNAALLCGLILTSAACGAATPGADELPTLAMLPSDAPPTATAAGTAAQIAAVDTPTASATPTITPSATPTVTPSATITDTPTPTATDTLPPSATPEPPADNEGILALAQLAAQATILPTQFFAALPSATPVTSGPMSPNCPFAPPGGFATVFQGDATLPGQIGCPLGAPPAAVTSASASQLYERGEMIWLQGPPGAIYALYTTGRFQRYDDTYNAAVDPISGGETPPLGLREPIRGFGKVWRAFAEVRAGLGWAVTEESGANATAQAFERGQMIYLPQRGQIFILVNDPGSVISGSWRAVAGSY